MGHKVNFQLIQLDSKSLASGAPSGYNLIHLCLELLLCFGAIWIQLNWIELVDDCFCSWPLVTRVVIQCDSVILVHVWDIILCFFTRRALLYFTLICFALWTTFGFFNKHTTTPTNIWTPDAFICMCVWFKCLFKNKMLRLLRQSRK